MVKNKKPIKRNKFKVFMLSFLTILIFLGIGTASYLYFSLSSLSNNSKTFLGKDNIKPIKPKGNKPVNILVMGVDIGTPGEKSKNDPKRTDTMILMNYNPKDKSVNLVSIPRDTLIKVSGKRHKINEAHALGGVSYSIDAVEKLLDLQVNYYAKVDYTAFREIIDSIGGIDMEIKNKMDYDDSSQDLHIHFKKGTTVHLDGKKAEEFFRWRKNNDGTGLAEGDLGRIQNQHIFIEKVIDKVKRPGIVTKIPSLVSTIHKYSETNMNANELLKYGYVFSKSDKSNIKMSTLEGSCQYINRISYFIYDERLNKELLSSLYGAGTNDNNAAIDKSKVKVQILNGTKKNGLASKYSDNLSTKGYSNVVVGNSDSKVSKSKVTVYNLDKAMVSKIKDEFNIDNVQVISDTSNNFDIVVLLGDDYDISNK